MQDSSSSASNRIPVAETVHGAIELARSGGAITMIYAAAQLANYRERPLGPRELFLAALALVTLVIKSLLEWRYAGELAAAHQIRGNL